MRIDLAEVSAFYCPRPLTGRTKALDDTKSDQLARDRTDLAEDRTVLAHERSFASWIRTGMASVGIGLGFSAIFPTLDPTWVAKAVASAFLLIAIFIFISAERRARTIISRMEAHTIAVLKPVRIRLLSWALVAATLALGLAIWALVPA